MCGIVGVLQIDGKPIDSQDLIRMRDLMRSRGPDDAGLWLDGYIGFGHRRLSIIDLSELGHQPMIDDETGAVIVYNGEIYNFQEIRSELEKFGFKHKSRSDTEVVLKAYRKWGTACVSRFNGMFSFAIWDPKKRGIFIARDRMGIKPLYYYSNNNVFMFASRMKALIAHQLCPKNIDQEALGLYLDLGFIPAPWSILKGVKKLRPGFFLWADDKGVVETCYWSLDSIKIDEALTKADERELVERLDGLMRDAVKHQMISDVPLGVLLSGGIDSSLVTALMCQQSRAPIKTFTIGFEEGQYNESQYAGNIAAYLKTDHHSKIMSSDDLLSLLDDNTLNYDEPLADSSSLPTMMVSRLAGQEVKVCLSGDGGDELFAGYHFYPILSYLQGFYGLPFNLRKLVGNSLAQMSSAKYAIIGESFAQPNIESSFANMRNIMGGSNRQANLSLNRQSLNIKQLFADRSVGFSPLDEVSKACRLDAAYYLTDDVLQKVDVASMSVGLEVRVPILDHKIVEFSGSLPIKFKLRGLKTKWILKQVLSKYVPEKLFDRPKRGFAVPIGKWLRGDLSEMMQDELSPKNIEQFGQIDPIVVKRLINLHLSNKYDTHQALWALLCLLRWDKQFRQVRENIKL